jgi:hypothetical protein
MGGLPTQQQQPGVGQGVQLSQLQPTQLQQQQAAANMGFSPNVALAQPTQQYNMAPQLAQQGLAPGGAPGAVQGRGVAAPVNSGAYQPAPIMQMPMQMPMQGDALPTMRGDGSTWGSAETEDILNVFLKARAPARPLPLASRARRRPCLPRARRTRTTPWAGQTASCPTSL